MKGWLLALAAAAALASSGAVARIEATARFDAGAAGVRINPDVYGQFAEHLGTGIDGGIWVGEDSPIPNIRGFRTDVVEALRALRVPVGPRARRPVTLNKWWGNTEEANQFGTHEYFDFAELIGARTYLNVNVGTATPEEAMEWVEYVTHAGNSTLARERRANGRDRPWKIDYIGIGNEMWGFGGNLTADEFAPLLRRFATFLRDPNGPRLIAGGPTGGDYQWTEVLMRGSRAQIDAISLHYYTLPTGDWTVKGPGVGFDETAWARTFARTRQIEEYIREHDARMDVHDPENRLGLMVAEWGSWYDPTPGTNAAFLQQENTLRDGLIAALNFNIFHRHAARVQMANIAQMVNVLQAMILTDGPRMVLTPTYHAFAMYRPFQGAMAIPVTTESPDYVVGETRLPAIDVTVARGADGKLLVGLVNVDPDESATVRLLPQGLRGGRISGEVLTAAAMDARNSYDAPAAVRPAPFRGARWREGRLEVEMPAKSVVVLTLDR
jgi:alpha-N-arabinofuranosidase